MEVHNPAATTSFWTASSWHRQEIVPPALPTAYDAALEWGTEPGRYRLWACNGWEQHSNRASLPRVILEWACGVSDPVSGATVE